MVQVHRERRTHAGIGLPALTIWLVVFGIAVYALAGWPPAIPALPTELPSWVSLEVWLRSPMLSLELALPVARFAAVLELVAGEARCWPPREGTAS